MKIKTLLLISPSILALASLVGCKTVKDPDWITRDNWYDLTSNAVESDIGKTVKVKVNGLDHLVRLIGIDHDVDEKNNKLHTTWEFANLISDKDGNSLAYQWNDANALDPEISGTVNYDYINSTIRFALNGHGNNGGKQANPRTKDLILPAQKHKTKFDIGTYDKPIFTMLPSALQKKIKTVKKTVGVREKKEYDYVETEYTDKLFMLSGIEIGSDSSLDDDKGYGTVYKYYSQQGISKVKSQVNSEFSEAYDIHLTDSMQAYLGVVYNFAGQNEGMFTKYGGTYWLRSPFSNYTRSGSGAYCCHEGGIIQYHEVYNHAFAVAPAFCI